VDERLRSLERQAEHDPEAAARLLLERVRRGDLDEARLILAAHLEHEPARRAIGDAAVPPAPAPCADVEDLGDWLGALTPFGPVVLVRAFVIASRDSLPAFEALAPDDTRPAAASAAAERWCEAPSLETARTASAGGKLAHLAAEELGRRADFRADWAVDTPELYSGTHVAWLCKHAAAAAFVLEPARVPTVGPAAHEGLVRTIDTFVRALRCVGTPVERVREVTRVGLLRWALGQNDV
jgi:hypothetical protein